MRLQIVVLALTGLCVFGQTPGYKPGDYQKDNPNYPKRNPFYFEGRIDWNLLKIDSPNDTWEFAQRGIYRQDDLGDIEGAISDYKRSISMNSLENGTCQLVTSIPANAADFANLTPAPCMFTVRLRLAHLLKEKEPEATIALYKEVMKIDPLRLGVNALLGEFYEEEAEHAATPEEKEEDLRHAVEVFKAELALSPVTPLSIKLTGDEANNGNIHWALAHIYEELNQPKDAEVEYDLYLKAAKWHSDPYPWRIEIAKKKLTPNQ